jgi:hypothetical protein
VKRVLAFVCWWFVLFWLWFLLVGEWNRYELVAGAAVAAAAAAHAEGARALGRVGRLPAPATLAAAPAALWQIVVDFGVITWVLVRSLARRRVVRGEWIERTANTADAPWIAYLATFSPNAYPVEVDTHERTAVFHDLVPRRDSEAPL